MDTFDRFAVVIIWLSIAFFSVRFTCLYVDAVKVEIIESCEIIDMREK